MLQPVENTILAYASSDIFSEHEDLFVGEHSQLIRLCVSLTGNIDAAEDLAQETLLEAWRNQHKLHDQQNREGWRKWLSAIARNVCMRWARTHRRDVTHLIPFKHYEDGTELTLENIPAEDCDVEIELERDELANLLDRALALLPSTARDVLIEHYIQESSHAEIAAHLGLNEDALVQRLYRGKLALRRVITTHMSEEAEAYGLSMPQSDKEKLEQETRIWCPMCSKSHLLKYYDATSNRTGFTCPKCWHIACADSQVQSGVRSPKSLLARQISQLGAYYWNAINTGQIPCFECGLPAHAIIYTPHNVPPEYSLSTVPTTYHNLCIRCSACDYEEFNALPHLTLDLPEMRAFWRKHPRIQWKPGLEIEHNGQPALVCSFQSVTDAAHLDVIYKYDTLNVLGIYGSVLEAM